MSVMQTTRVDLNEMKGRVLLQSFVLALFISLSPIKLLSYFLPVLLLVFVVFSLPSKALFKNLLVTFFICGSGFLFYFLKSVFLGHDFSLVGAFLSLLTYGSLIFILLYPTFSIQHDSAIFKSLNKILYAAFVVETVVALLQVILFIVIHMTSLDGATGDIVQGTINPLSFINESVGFNNQVFTINYIFLLIYLMPYLKATKRQYMLAVGAVVILIASVLHVVFSFLLGLLTCFFLIGLIRYRKQVIKFLVLGSALTTLLFVTQPKNFSLFSFYYNNIVSLESPKSLILINTLAFLPEKYPDALLFGLGPGQYTSRASLMTTGHYFGEFENPTKLPLLDGSFTSEAFKSYVYDIWASYATNVEQYGNSTMSRPFFSILSVLIEFGFIVFVVIVAILIRQTFKMRKQYLIVSKEKKKLEAYYSFVNIVSILSLFYLAFFENYLESSASICTGLLLIKFFQGFKQNCTA